MVIATESILIGRPPAKDSFGNYLITLLYRTEIAFTGMGNA